MLNVGDAVVETTTVPGGNRNWDRIVFMGVREVLLRWFWMRRLKEQILTWC